MKAQELRIGNWVKWVFPNRNNQPNKIKYCQVQSIGGLVGVLDSAYGYDQVEPIPLTEQWLIDFGFEKDDTGVDIHDQDYHEWYQKEFPIIGVLCQSSDKTYLFDENTDTLRIKHVHQLQNLYFALTGEDLHL